MNADRTPGQWEALADATRRAIVDCLEAAIPAAALVFACLGFALALHR